MEYWYEEMEKIAGLVLIMVVAMGFMVWSIYHLLAPSPYSISHNQQVVFEHTNLPDQTDNQIAVYCDIPSMDRIYIINKDHVTVVPGGCKGLP